MSVHASLVLGMLVLVVAAAVTDLVTRRIPNLLLLTATLLALPLQALGGNLGDAVLGWLTGLLLFLPLYLLRGMAAGDVKLMATVGALAGPAATVEIAVLAWCWGGVMVLLLVTARGRLAELCANLRALTRPWLLRAAGLPALPEPRASVGAIPYGVAIALATLTYLWPHP
jgi:prepilin peptidase CpaA